jgi:hypothetical protein
MDKVQKHDFFKCNTSLSKLFRINLIFLFILNNVNQLIFVMVKCGVLFEVRTEFLNNI